MHFISSLASPHGVSQHPVLAVAALCFGGMAAALTQTLVIPIQGELPALLDAAPTNTAWVVTITLLAGAVSMPVSGRLADLYGKQRVLVVSAAILLAGSVLCALSSSLEPMLVGRALQGLAMGFIPVGISLMREITPPEMSGTAIATMSATLGIGGAIGLPLSAWIVDVGDWHALFWVATGFAAAVLLLVVLVVPHVHDDHPGRLDLLGVLGLAVGLVSFLVGVSKANEWGWGSPETVGAIAGGIVVLLVWAAYQWRSADPLIDLRTSARPAVLVTNIAAVAIGFGMMAQSIVVPQLLQMPEATGYGLGQSILAAGLWMAPGGLMMLLFAPISSRLIRNAGARRTLMLGAAVIGLGYVLATFLMGAPWQLLVASCVTTAGVGIGYAAMPTLIMDAAPPREAGAAVGLNALARSVGTTVAAAVMAAVLTGSTTSLGGAEVPSEGAFRWCFLIGAVAAFVGVVLVAFIPRRSPDPVRPGTPAAIPAGR